MSDIDKAAQAFETDMGMSSAAPAQSESNNAPVIEQWDVFDREHEDDVIAGGDGEPDPKPVVQQDDEDDGLEIDDGQQSELDEQDEDADLELDDEDDDDAPGEPGDFESAEFDVIVDGEPAKVTGKEMREGYIRTETFHQRLNKLNQAGQQMEQVATKLFADREAVAAKLAEAEEMIAALIPDEPDWDELFKTNPTAARSQQKAYKAIQDKIAEIKTKKETVTAEQRADSNKRYNDWVRTQNAKTVASNPSWAGEHGQANMQRDLTAMADLAKSVGFSEEEIKNTHDSRMIAVLLKAAKYDRLEKKRIKPTPRGKPTNPGAGRTRTAPKGAARPQQLRRPTGSLDEAANAFGSLLAQEKRTKRRG